MDGFRLKQRMPALIQHLNDVHGQSLSYEHYTFENDEQFNEWLWKTERDVPCSFNRLRRSNNKNYETYKCSRSLVSRPYNGLPNLRKRRMKLQGPTYVGFTCPAHIKRHKMKSGASTVQFLSKHFCNADKLQQLAHVRLSEPDRKWFAGKLAQGIPVDTIIREARKNLENQLTRRFVITRKDLRNICTSYGIAFPERRHPDDATSVETLVRSFLDNDNSPIILYKCQGDSHISIGGGETDEDNRSVEPSDFLLGYMDSSQCDMLKLCGAGDRSGICCDSIHGTNTYKFFLTAVMVLNRNCEGFPVAFLFSTRKTENILELFFRAIKHRSGQIDCYSFMSDMAPQSYSAWQRIMGDSPNRLYSAWHVDKAFRENIQRCIKDSVTRDSTYRMIKTLMEEIDINRFEVSKSYVLSELYSNENTADFAKYFDSNYSMCTQLWACCYRTNCGVNTNTALERMHDLLKQKYQDIKQNKSLDSAIQSVIYMQQDKQSDHFLAVSRGKYSRKLSELRKRHNISLRLDVQCFEICPQREWTVYSSSGLEEGFMVTRTDKRCKSCNLRCVECCACIHDFSCTCTDMAIKHNMCKHIHYVCKKYPLGVTDVDTAYDDISDLIETATEVDMAYDDQMHIIDENDHDRRQAQAEADAHIAVLSDPLHTNTHLSVKRDVARQLVTDISYLIDTGTGNDELSSIIESLRVVRPRMEAVTASRHETP